MRVPGANSSGRISINFVDLYLQARSEVPRALAEHQEYEFRERLRFICRSSLLTLEEREREEVVEKLYSTYWQSYSANCYASEDVADTLPILKGRFRLGVVSNFMVDGGIEELLRKNRIDQFFRLRCDLDRSRMEEASQENL